MLPRLLPAALAFLLPLAAQAADGLPNYDPLASCAQAARSAGDRDAGPRAECLDAETAAQALAPSLWAGKSTSLRQRCARLSERRRSFVTLNTCLRSNASGTR